MKCYKFNQWYFLEVIQTNLIFCQPWGRILSGTVQNFHSFTTFTNLLTFVNPNRRPYPLPMPVTRPKDKELKVLKKQITIEYF